jgi:tRNA(Ile)-lysidine synthase
LEQVRKTVQRHQLFKAHSSLVIGVSGGPDSVALACLLCALQKEFGLKLHIAHLDHMLRKDSPKDCEFVRGLAARLRIPVTVGHIDVKALVKRQRHGSTEEVARNARLAFFSRVLKSQQADSVALGHTQDDQAETILMRIIRGAGLYGLAGILPVRTINGLRIIRPLIETERSQIEAYLRKRRIIPRRDSTNREDVYLRNRIRNRLLPTLEKQYNRNIKQVLCSMSEHVGSDYDFLHAQARKFQKSFAMKIDLARFKKLHPAMQRMVLRLYIADLKGDTRRITFAHIKEIDDLVHNRPAYSIVDLPRGVSVKKTPASLCFYKKQKNK